MNTTLVLPAQDAAQLVPQAVKRCARCETSKLLDAFSRYARTSDGRQSYCKPCASSYRRAWRKASRERERET